MANIAREKLPDGSKTEFRVAVENEADQVVYQASLKFRGETGEEMAEHRKFEFSGVHKVVSHGATGANDRFNLASES